PTARAASAVRPAPRSPPEERADTLQRLHAALMKRMGEIAQTISLEMGSPIAWSQVGQALASFMVLDYYAKLARSFPFEEPRESMIGRAVVRQEPGGGAGGMRPWEAAPFATSLRHTP